MVMGYSPYNSISTRILMEFTLLNIFSSSVFPLDLFVKIGDSPLYFWLINFSLPLPVRTC